MLTHQFVSKDLQVWDRYVRSTNTQVIARVHQVEVFLEISIARAELDDFELDNGQNTVPHTQCNKLSKTLLIYLSC